jgi:light-regulated signal transduction histidine kinase (bacteriophytochrome)
MTEAVTPPIKSGGSTTPAITEGVQARLRHLREAVNAFCNDLREMERLEKSLLAAIDRLDRHSHLIGGETQLLEQLLKRDSQRKAVQPVSVVSIVDKVEEDLARLIVDARAEKAG